MRVEKLIIYILLGCIFAGCDMHREPERLVPLELRMCLPAQEAAYYAPARRSIGDPGGREVLALPRYAYIFITREDGGVGSIWRKEELIMEAENWEMTKYSGLLMENGNYIYQYKKKINFLLSGDTPKGKVYVICSNKRLTFTPSFASISTLEDVENLKFNTEPDSIQENLQNIYSTPYNYTKRGNYYCMYDCSVGNGFTVELLLYHIAAKVDIKWSVDKEKRINKNNPSSAVRLTYMKVQNLFNSNAYCFKPMRNEVPSILNDGKSVEMANNNEGLWWEGRSYFYTIPYTVTGEPDYFPLQMLMRTNDSGGTGYKPTLNLTIDTSTVFVPWLRAIFNFSEPLTDKEETKTIDN